MSQAQLPIDWQAVKAAGIVGVMVRATQGVRDSQPVGVDTAFVNHVEGALAAGLRVGVYHAYIPHRDPVEQALFFAAVTAPYHERLTLGYAIDAELDYGMDAAVITERLHQLARALASGLDITPIIYTSLNFWNNHVLPTYDAFFGTLPLWVAAWGTDSPKVLRGFSSIWLHQYGHEMVDGQLIDMNRIPPKAQSERRFIIPVDFPYVLSSGFNAPRDYAFAPHRKQLHEGADFAPTKAAVEPYRVVAPAAGKVDKIGFDAKGYGNYVRIVHEDGFVSWLAHLKAPSPLKVGAHVEIGDVVGYAGSTGGTSTGVHAHWTLQRIGQGAANYVVADVVNPLEYVLT